MDVIVTADGSKTLTSSEFGETYGSRHGALTEAVHVFLRGSGVADRLAGGRPTRVLEVGFGTGLNFLVTAAAAVEHGAGLHYTALERAPLDSATLRQVHALSSLPATLIDEFIGWVDSLADPPAQGTHTLAGGGFATVVLDLIIGEATRSLGDDLGGRAGDAVATFDAIYLDGFSPRANPDLWSQAFLTRLAAGLAPGGMLVTFSVSGAVRRALAAAGLEVRKQPGPPGGKPEMLAARRAPGQP